MKHFHSPKETRSNRPIQTSGNELLLNRIKSRRRGIRTPRAMARRYRLPIRILITLSILAGLSFVSYRYIYLNPRLSVGSISIIGGGKFVNTEDFHNIAEQKTLGKSIFSVNPQEIEEILASNFLGARNIEVSKDYPDKLVIKVEERIPLAVIRTSGTSVYYLIDREGYVLGEVSDEFMDLPKIVYEGEIRIGTFLNDRIVPVSIEILSEAGRANLDVSSVSFKERYSKLYLGPTEVFLSNFKDIKESVSVLEKLYKTLLLEGKSVIKIDLRYDKVIVLYE